MNWQERWRMYFYKIDNPVNWEEELARRFYGLKSVEIDAAIKKIADSNTDYPTMRHLAIMISRGRKTNNPSASCPHCTDGWVVYHSTSIPCTCSRGKHWLVHYYLPEHHSRFKRKAQAAITRNAEDAELMRKLSEENNDKPLKDVIGLVNFSDKPRGKLTK